MPYSHFVELLADKARTAWMNVDSGRPLFVSPHVFEREHFFGAVLIRM